MNENLKEHLDALDAFEKLYIARYLLHAFITKTEKDYEEHLKSIKKNEK